MLQTIYEGDSCFPTVGLQAPRQIPAVYEMRGVDGSGDRVEVKPEVPSAPLDLRTTDVRMLGSTSDPSVWEKQLQQELLLIQKQQQIQKQLLITEFQKQHENLTRQHQAQLQQHLKLQQELLAMRQQQELLEKERKLEQQSREQEMERHRREQQALALRSKERTRKSAVASTEVKQKLQEFLLSKSAKDPSVNGGRNVITHHPKLWYHRSAHHTSLEQSSPPLGGASPTYKYTPPSPMDCKDDFPLRKTASEPNLKVRSRLKQKVAERRSSPLLRRTDSAPYKKRTLELLDSTSSSNAPGTGPSSPSSACSTLGGENGPSPMSTNTQTECWPIHQRILKPKDSMALLSLYTSPSLPNITLGLPASPSPLSAGVALKDSPLDCGGVGTSRQPPSGPFLGASPLQSSLSSGSLEAKPTGSGSSHQALLQHLLLKEQMRHHKILSTGPGSVPVRPQSPLPPKDRLTPSVRHKLPRHRPLHRTQSAPLPQGALAQLVIQQQHQHFLERQKQYQQQVHINKMLSKSIEQLRQPSSHLQESEEEDPGEQAMQEDRLPPRGVIRNCSSGSDGELHIAKPGLVKVKEEMADSEDECPKEAERSSYLRQANGKDFAQRLVIRAMI
ncbi:histone deacetylase 9-B isoform X3 [Paramormyrops kingsleyae]|uniref:histone deacetylase 9-B isoform X3 n=1 Tax=Paramormyrops kingsleyae TaxID=1676925 RepID=UPI003B9785A2